jgi:hypothetical protein
MSVQVTAYLSRDLDSRLTGREVAAVSEWLATGRAFHFMRDHPDHGTTILGSGWGWRYTADSRARWRTAWKRALKDRPLAWAPRDDWGPDQALLHK